MDTVDAHTYELNCVEKALSEATHDRSRRDENELSVTQKELEHLRHLADYYKGSTQTTMCLKDEFDKVYDEFKKER
jgi:hypothetical protein